MKYFFIFLFTISINAQILPSQQGSHYKKTAIQMLPGSLAFNNCGKSGSTGPSQSDCNTAYASSALNGEVTVTSGIQYWTVPANGTYTITAVGATAGNESDTNVKVGLPAKIIGNFSLTQGDVIKILVGQHGWKASCRPGWGAGGGTFVTKNDNTILVIAGGAGSGHMSFYGTYSYQNANTGESGNSDNSKTHNGGTGGDGGDGSSSGGSGAGYSGNGTTGNGSVYQACAGVPNAHTVPQSFLNGGVGDVIGGGFGGGGGVTNTWGGGGGGYSGGGGAKSSSPYTGAGGGSKNNGTSQTNSLSDNDLNTETDGSVTITW